MEASFNQVGSSVCILREHELVERAKALKVNVGTDPSADLGPVITNEVNKIFCIFCLLICFIKNELHCKGEFFCIITSG